jgi:hypothetical protein
MLNVGDFILNAEPFLPNVRAFLLDVLPLMLNARTFLLNIEDKTLKFSMQM